MEKNVIGKRGEKEKNPSKVGDKMKAVLVNDIDKKLKGNTI